MNILGINTSHTATACLLIDGKIVACISEERLSGIKNQSGLPVLAAKNVLDIAKLRPADVDYLVLSFTDPKVNAGFAALAKAGRARGEGWQTLTSGLLDFVWWTKENLLTKVPPSRILYEKGLPPFYNLFIDPQMKEKVLNNIEKKLKIPRSRVKTLDHHTAHAFSAYFSDPNHSKRPKLVFTLDGMGDGLCATVSVVEDGRFKTIARTPAGSSIGDLYSFATGYLGMKMGEHEYKVMGLAPYGPDRYVHRVYDKIKDLVWVNPDLTFGTKIHSHAFYKILPKLLINERFDNISGAIQKLTEKLLVAWVRKAILKTRIKDVVCGGGVFMNVKANQKILEIPEVKSLFVMPSCGDESTAIGAAYWGYKQVRGDWRPEIEPLGSLYLGGEFSERDIQKELELKKYRKYKIQKIQNIELQVAKLLAKEKIVARFNGKMEWGARALGNRSILAHPSSLDVIRTINEQIKSRDFWMPFAPSIMHEQAHKYILDAKKMDAPYMIVTFDPTDLGRLKFKAAMHQYDNSLRPQTVDKDWNPSYWKILSEFEKLTGIGGVLNTSFNLHGYPIVYTPKDALYVFENSGLEFLAIGKYLVKK